MKKFLMESSFFTLSTKSRNRMPSIHFTLFFLAKITRGSRKGVNIELSGFIDGFQEPSFKN